MGRFLDIDPSSWLESHTKGRTTPLGADHSRSGPATECPSHGPWPRTTSALPSSCSGSGRAARNASNRLWTPTIHA
ncbi:protein of unknown function [Methylorubrum extorquens]|uniref:Uncharacterized protein n=1 Tax=Methylorubrum extorquens TaxID=408 RepID=A0A2N9AYJ2_METEX|nr:protein of unknown function [Methylorubrum extorquens]